MSDSLIEEFFTKINAEHPSHEARVRAVAAQVHEVWPMVVSEAHSSEHTDPDILVLIESVSIAVYELLRLREFAKRIDADASPRYTDPTETYERIKSWAASAGNDSEIVPVYVETVRFLLGMIQAQFDMVTAQNEVLIDGLNVRELLETYRAKYPDIANQWETKTDEIS